MSMHIEIDIVASPEEVRAVILDFASYHEWHSSFIRNIRTIPAGRPSIELIPGNKIQVDVPGAKDLESTIVCNTPVELRWHGASAQGAFYAQHYFKFRERIATVRVPPEKAGDSAGTKSRITTFGHGEVSTGWMCFWANEGWPEPEAVEEMYTGFAKDLKARVEGLKAKESIEHEVPV